MKDELQISFEECVKECLKNPELLEQYTRLNPPKEYLHNKRRKQEHERHILGFYSFIRDYIWLPVITKSL